MSMEDLTIREMKQAVDLLSGLIDTTMSHAMVIVGEPTHDCATENIDDGEFDDMPEFDDFDVRVFLAYEQSVMAVCRLTRIGLQQQGYSELTEQVGG